MVPVDGGAAQVGGVSTSYNGWDTAMIVWLAPHDAVAGQMAGLAATRSRNSTVRAIAAATDTETQDRYLTLSRFATAWGQPAPSTDPDAASGHDHGGGTSESTNIDQLQKAPAAGFDKLFLTLMIGHHKAALPIARAAIDNGTNPQDKAFAAQVLSSQQAEITQMQKALAAL
ncbi:hypothetical protein GCM10011594_07150 [Nakamurella endophytica]|uniref:DUF305 domain-containing protein n=1 Tax=Nakamurella endophytica TaxID=1748367 RepID=A0A917WBE5_9ACTN|nr:hypothetical protein GCM10011594_07150 [Nakamurella endophytica]